MTDETESESEWVVSIEDMIAGDYHTLDDADEELESL
ncbi:hypothetical protein Natoc_2270 [Natronococcus occultus SP4]|uniref:Uncharacterized protein n=1 Tax=Natronococcus occultus SP4 TaxID=694430 RepID=L0K1Q4_9EURY|nr:hypothetical protein Natoc_2270 [Natronococcus occultus SP4]